MLRSPRLVVWLLGVLLVAVVAAAVIELYPRPAAPAGRPVAAGVLVAGVWQVNAPSTSGYTVAAHVGPLPMSLTGSTTAVSGGLTLMETRGSFTISGLHLATDLRKIHSGDPGADAGMAQTLDLAAHPTAILSQISRLGAISQRTPVTVAVPVVLTVNGHRVSTTLSLMLSGTATGLQLSGTAGSSFASLGVVPPPAPGITVTPHFSLVFHLVLRRTG